MVSMRIIQIIDGYRNGDGVGNVVTVFDKYFRNKGYDTKIVNRQLLASDLEMEVFGEEDIVFYHLAFLYDPLVDRLPCKKVLVFHNITEPRLLVGFDEEARIKCSAGRCDFRKTAAVFDYAIAFSDYSVKNLLEVDWTESRVFKLPIGIDTDSFAVIPDEQVINKYRKKGTNVLFTGRVYPNKKQENVIASFARYRKEYDSEAQLFLVGSLPKGNYYPSLVKYAERLGVADSVILTGHVTYEEYMAYYRIADIFLCMSEHEGFCIPLVEAMYFHVPIIAYNATAVPDTLGGCGILVNEKNPDVVAKEMYKVISDKNYREHILNDQDNRYDRISSQNLDSKYGSVFNKIIDDCKKNSAYENVQKDCMEDDCVIFREIDQPFADMQSTEGRQIIVYGAGAWGSRVYIQVMRTLGNEKLAICDRAKAGTYDEELGCTIISPKEAYEKYNDAIWVISLQDRRGVLDVAMMLRDWGVDSDSIRIYDKFSNIVR